MGEKLDISQGELYMDGEKVEIVDFEDSLSVTTDNTIIGELNDQTRQKLKEITITVKQFIFKIYKLIQKCYEATRKFFIKYRLYNNRKAQKLRWKQIHKAIRLANPQFGV